MEPNKINIEDITVDDIIAWIIANRENEKDMSLIATTAYPYSEKFKNRYSD